MHVVESRGVQGRPGRGTARRQAIFESRGVQGCPGRGTARRQASPAPWASLDAPGLKNCLAGAQSRALSVPGRPGTQQHACMYFIWALLALLFIVYPIFTLQDLVLYSWIHPCRCFEKIWMIRN